ncbi:MAG: CHAT domain-containing protein [Candidatus Omnitrophica bacterium]|nr:CHAT domain-containing protein [Candidatus Omnitrophota bacterium]
MSDPANSLVLEVFRSSNVLKMSILEEREEHKTVRHYSQCMASFDDVKRICREIIAVLRSAGPRHALGEESLEVLKKNGRLLWEQLLTRPVRDRLTATKLKDLVLSLEEELVGIPWELLYDGSDFLGLKFNVGRVIRSRHEEAHPQYRSLGGKLRMLILANPTNDLPSAYDEGINIRNQFDKAREKISIDFKSTSIDSLYVKKNLREYDIVHFAGHCEYDPEEPRSTGWVMSDGRFTTQDILSIGQGATLPTLVFANACQSAQVDRDHIDQDCQEKTYSLASSFLFSGVRHYIGAVQRIEDPVSFTFAREFYTQLLRGKSVGSSLRIGRLRLVKEYGINSLVWALYLLYGEPTFCLFRTRSKVQKPAALSIQSFCILHRRRLIACGSTLAAACVIAAAALFVPRINPSAYYWYKRAEHLARAGKNAGAIQAAERAREKDPGLLAAYPLLADTCYRLGKNEEAARYYFDYIVKSTEHNNIWHLANSYILAGWHYHRFGQYPRAFEFYDKALVTSRAGNDKLHEAVALRKLALWYMDKEEYDKALELLTKSAEINRERRHLREHRYNLACDYFDLGLLFSNREDTAAARDFYGKSRGVFLQLGLKNEMSDFYFNLGELYLMDKEYGVALQYYLKGLAIDRKQANLPSLAGDYTMLGELYMEMDNLEKAEEYFKLAEAQAREIKAPMELAAASFDLGLVYKKRGWKSRARASLRTAEEIFRGIDTPAYREVQDELLSLDR